MATLLLIRHGQASYGQVDYDRLSARGQEQARHVGAFLAATPVDALYVGPLTRQRQTVEHAASAAEAAGRALPRATVLGELAEYPAFDMIQHFMPKLVAEDAKFAELPTRPTRELADAAFRTILGRWSRDEWQIDGVETVVAFSARVRAGLDKIIRDTPAGGRIAIVTSAGPIGVTEERMVGTSRVVRNASITELKLRTRDFAWHPERVSLLTFNLTHHLPAELQTEY